MRKIFFYSVLFSVLFLTSTNCFAKLPVSVGKSHNQTTSIAPMLKNVMPAVVNIAVRGEVPLMQNPMQRGQSPGGHSPLPRGISPKFNSIGSGAIVDAQKGYILTNAHVIKDAQSIVVTLKDGRRIRANIIGYDIPSDIAVLQINAKHLTQIHFDDSDKVQVGDFVAAIGNPFGLQQTVTSGVVSGLERTNLGIEGYEDFIQTDAPINPGNSGGALVNMQGKLIGINTAIITPGYVSGSVGIGLAIPSNMAKSVMQQLIDYGKVKRGILGVGVQDLTPSLADAMHVPNIEGALVSQVNPNTPADKAGIKVRDLITNLNGKPIHSAAQVSNNVSVLRAGSDITIKLLRNHKKLTIKTNSVDPRELQKEMKARPEHLLAGLELRNFNQLVSNKQIKGAQVLNVGDTSLAYSSGLRPGDIIIAANDKPITTINELQKAAEKNPKRLLLTVQRGMLGEIFLVLAE